MISRLPLLVARTALAFTVAPLVDGIIRKTKARFQCRRGPSLLQPYRDLLKLRFKEDLAPETTSWIFRATPLVLVVTTAVAAALLPIPALPAGGFASDPIVFLYMLAAGRFFTLLAALDTGSTFTAMASSREATFAALAEPAVLLAIFLLAAPGGQLDFGAMIRATVAGGGSMPGHLLAVAALTIMAILETGRVPVDNPATHLELTMVHEGLILEHAGRDLALMSWGASVRQLLLFTLVLDLAVPGVPVTRPGVLALVIGLGVYLGKLALVAIGVGTLESAIAKMRLFQVPDLVGLSVVLSVLALVTSAMGR